MCQNDTNLKNNGNYATGTSLGGEFWASPYKQSAQATSSVQTALMFEGLIAYCHDAWLSKAHLGKDCSATENTLLFLNYYWLRKLTAKPTVNWPKIILRIPPTISSYHHTQHKHQMTSNWKIFVSIFRSLVAFTTAEHELSKSSFI